MNINYQRLQAYDGNLYGALGNEYIEHPNTIPSPGGIFTGYYYDDLSKYTIGRSTGDIYAGQGNRYVHGEFENVYNTGNSASDYMGYYNHPPDPTFLQNMPTKNPPARPVPLAGHSQTSFRENFQHPKETNIKSDASPIQDFGSTENTESTAPLANLTGAIITKNPFLLFVILVVLYITMDFWTAAGSEFIAKRFHGGRDLSWKWLLFYALLFTAILVILTQMTKVPLVQVENS